jgi:hypothetical protein
MNVPLIDPALWDEARHNEGWITAGQRYVDMSDSPNNDLSGYLTFYGWTGETRMSGRNLYFPHPNGDRVLLLIQHPRRGPRKILAPLTT